jgi:predicted transposase/invertase (TIGR01784 family)
VPGSRKTSLTVDYLLRLNDEGLKDAYASHLRNLEMKEGDSKMYQSMIEEVARKEYREKYQSMIEEMAMKEAMEKGLEKGMKKSKQEMAKNLLARGISPDIIAESSGLSRDDVCALMN